MLNADLPIRSLMRSFRAVMPLGKAAQVPRQRYVPCMKALDYDACSLQKCKAAQR